MTPQVNGYHGVLREIPHSMDFAPTVPVPLAEDAQTPDLAEVLSPSQANTYLACSARWWFKYGLQLPEIKGSSLTIGRCLHAAMKVNFEQKKDTGKDMPSTGLAAVYTDAWEQEAPETHFEPDEDQAELKAMGAALVQKYLDEAAWQIQPKAVELPVEGEIAGVKVRGFVDLVDIDGRIIEMKTANRTPDKIRPDYRFQLSTYSRITPGASGRARIDTVVKLKRDVKLSQQRFDITDADERALDTLYPLIQEGMRSGIYTPNRNHLMCSRRYCSFWMECQREFGGEVGE